MVSILPPKGSPWQLIGRAISNFAQNPPPAIQQAYNRNQLQKSLDEIKQIASDPNASPLDTLLATMKAGAGIPGSERYLSALAPELIKFSQAKRMQNVPGVGEQPVSEQVPRTREPLEPAPERKALPEFMGKEGFFPTNVGPQGGPGQVPQEATTGQKLPLLTPSQKVTAAKDRAKELTAAGIPTTPQEAMKEINQFEDDKRLHNQAVDEELKQRIAGQQTYGERAANELVKVYPQATSEQKAIFQKKGEEASKQGKSEADINRYLANEAVKFKNIISGVEQDISAPRLQNRLQREFLGTDKSFEQAADDLRVKLKPLLDLGMYDTARNLLAKQGYYPEEREIVLNPMNEREKTLMNKVPKVKTKQTLGRTGAVPGMVGFSFEKEPINLEDIKSGLMDLKQANPNFSLVLARKAFEDKGYDWRSFKDALNELVLSDKLQLEDDQKNQYPILDNPPLNRLERILESIKLIGR